MYFPLFGVDFYGFVHIVFKDMIDSKLTNVFLGILCLIALGAVLSMLETVLLPFVIAVFLSYIFKPVVLALRKRKVPMALALLLIVAVLAGILFGLSMLISSSVQSFLIEMPKYQARLEILFTGLFESALETARELGIDTGEWQWSDAIQISSLTAFVTSSVGSLFSFLGSAFLILLFMLFILAGSGQMAEKVDAAFSHDQSHRIAAIVGTIDEKVKQYLITKTIVSLATGILTTVVLAIIGVDFALLWGFLAFLLNFIPNIGSIVAAILPFLISLVQFETITQPLLVLALLIVVQNVMGNIIEPKLMAFSLNLSPLLILVALMFWGWLWGIWGMILAVPIMSMVKIVFENVDGLKPLAVLMSGSAPKKK